MYNILKQYHTITKVKAELDQFCKGLEALGGLKMMERDKDAMEVFLVQTTDKR